MVWRLEASELLINLQKAVDVHVYMCFVEVLVLAVLTVSLQQQQDEVQIVCSYGNHCELCLCSGIPHIQCFVLQLLTRVCLCMCVFNCMQICDLVQ